MIRRLLLVLAASIACLLLVEPASYAATGLVFADFTPAAFDSDTTPVSVGNRFTLSSDISVTALRYYRQATDAPTVRVSLAPVGGAPLAVLDDTPSGGAGWVTLPLASPVTLSAGTTYVVWRYSAGQYSYTGAVFDSGPVAFDAGTIDSGRYVYSSSATSQPNVVPPSNALYGVGFTYDSGATSGGGSGGSTTASVVQFGDSDSWAGSVVVALGLLVLTSTANLVINYGRR